MAAAMRLRNDFRRKGLRAFAKPRKTGHRRAGFSLLAAIYDGGTRSEAARIGGVTLQIVRDWVLRFNAQGPEGARSTSQGAGRRHSSRTNIAPLWRASSKKARRRRSTASCAGALSVQVDTRSDRRRELAVIGSGGVGLLDGLKLT